MTAGPLEGVELPFDLHHDRLTTAQAADLAGVTTQVIWQWRHRGHVNALDPMPGERGRRYRGIDVLRAEALTRKAARRTIARTAAA